MRNSLFIIGFFIFAFEGFTQDTLILSGRPDYSFFGATTHRSDSLTRARFNASIEHFEPYRDSMIEFFKAKTEGKEKKAEKIRIEKLDNEKEFGLSMMFLLMRMKELDIIYQPMFQVQTSGGQDTNVLVSCTVKQMEEIGNVEGELEFKCVYLGELLMDGAVIYKLIHYQSK